MSDEIRNDEEMTNIETEETVVEETVDILEEEAEAAPEQEASAAGSQEQAPEGYEEGAGLAPFEGVADAGLDDAEGEDGEAPAAPEPIVYRELSGAELQSAVEATIFMHQKPVTISRLRDLINPEISEEDYRTAVSNLQTTYFEEGRGLELVEVANGWQLRTKVENKDIIRRMYQIAPVKLTNAMLEVLAIVAYNQPLTREGVDQIRGVDSSHLLRVLLDKKMLRIVGKSDTVGNPMIYGTTKEFLELFGLRDLSALPTLRELEEMLPKSEVGTISEEDALAQEMEGIVSASKPVDFNDLELEDWDPEEEKRELLGADEGGTKGPSWKERIRARREQITQQVAQGLDPAAPPATEGTAEEAAVLMAEVAVTVTEELQAEPAQEAPEARQMGSNDEQPQEIPNETPPPAGENGDGSPSLDGSAE